MDEITLSLPAKPEYVSVARLTVSAIANRIGFSMDEIEDIKVAISEAAIYLMNQGAMASLSWVFTIDEMHGLSARITGMHPDVDGTSSPVKQNELGLFIIESLMDEVEKDIQQGKVQGIRIYKSCGGQTA